MGSCRLRFLIALNAFNSLEKINLLFHELHEILFYKNLNRDRLKDHRILLLYYQKESIIA